LSFIVVAGSYCGGTSAVAGVVAALGADALPPFWEVDDPETPCTWESRAWRDLLRDLIDEATLAPKPENREVAIAKLRGFAERARSSARPPIVLKHPLAALLLDAIDAAFAPKFLLVFRPLDDVEDSRKRRGWSARLGAQAAQTLYGRMMSFFLSGQGDTMVLRYPDLIVRPEPTIAAIATFCGLNASRAADARTVLERR
jgi:hypothetical protein